jgi:hypothetical protein
MPLYKYLPHDDSIVIGNLKLRFTRPSGLNDPFELKPYIEAIATDDEIAQKFYEKFNIGEALEQVYDKLPKELTSKIPKAAFMQFMHDTIANNRTEFEGSIQGLLDKFSSELPRYTAQLRDEIHKHLERVGILSLTTAPDSTYMWTHYAASHCGYAVEFDETHPYFNRRRTEKDEFFHLREVTYYEQLPIHKTLSDLDGTKVFCTKSSQYAEEKEWRMLVPLPDVTSESSIAEELFDFPC